MSAADAIVMSLRRTADDYHAGRIDHTALRERNRAGWRLAEAIGVALNVRDLLRAQ